MQSYKHKQLYSLWQLSSVIGNGLMQFVIDYFYFYVFSMNIMKEVTFEPIYVYVNLEPLYYLCLKLISELFIIIYKLCTKYNHKLDQR